MAVLVWRHGTTRDRARQIIQQEIRKSGHEHRVVWKGDQARVSVGFGAVFHARGEVTDEAVVVDECGGAVGPLALERCRALLERLFPEGGPP